MKFKLDKATIKKIRIARRAERAFRKLTEKGNQMSPQQRLSHKQVMAKGLTQSSTKAEKRLRHAIAGLGFAQNPVIMGFIPDFANRTRKIIIEVDGKIHSREDVQVRDARKTSAFESHGWTVIRVSNEDVMERLQAVLKSIHRALGDLEHKNLLT